MVNFVFHLKSDEGHIERFSFDVYMSPLPIFTKIKQPFAWHISILVRHLSKYSDLEGTYFKISGATLLTIDSKKKSMAYISTFVIISCSFA